LQQTSQLQLGLVELPHFTILAMLAQIPYFLQLHPLAVALVVET
jgi:hypothetical protein